MSESPSIIVNFAFLPYGSTDKERTKFFYCGGGFNIVDYCDRPNACDNLPKIEQERIRSFVELSNKSEWSIVDYADTRKGSTGIFTPEEKFTAADKEILKNKMSQTKSNIWTSVISFTPEYGAQFCNNKETAREIIIKCFPELFKNTDMDVNNIDWFGAYHINTQNPHIHFVFWEREPLNIDSSGKKVFTRKGVLPNKNIDYFKTGIAKFLNTNKLDYMPMRDEIKAGALLYFKNNKAMLDAFYRSGKHIIDDGKFQYNRLSPENKKVIKAFVDKTINSSPELKNKYDDYKNHLKNTQAELIGLFTDVHFNEKNQTKKIPKEVCNFYATRVNELNDRLCNCFLKVLKNYAFNLSSSKTKYKKATKKVKTNIRTDTIYGTARSNNLTKNKAIITKDLMVFADKLIKDFVINGAEIVEECTKTDEQYKYECIQRGEELIYDTISENG